MTRDFTDRMTTVQTHVTDEQRARFAHFAWASKIASDAVDVIFDEMKSLERSYDCKVTRVNNPHGEGTKAVVVWATTKYEKRLFCADAPVEAVQFSTIVGPFEISFGPNCGKTSFGFRFMQQWYSLQWASGPGTQLARDPEAVELWVGRDLPSEVASIEDGLNYAALQIQYLFEGRVRRR